MTASNAFIGFISVTLNSFVIIVFIIVSYFIFITLSYFISYFQGP